jgi:phosphoribosyl 1,2-cyclic phosphodiesterase
MTLHLRVHHSGSDGNLTSLTASDGTTVLIDAGTTRARLVTALERLPSRSPRLAGVVYTHAHGDHVHHASLRLLIDRQVPLYMTEGTWRSVYGRLDAALAQRFTDLTRLVTPGRPFAIQGLDITACRVSHEDWLDPSRVVDPVCYRLSDGRDHVGYATDLGRVDDDVVRHLSGCGAVVLESNHDLDMLGRLDRDQGQKDWTRGDTGHLSNPQAAAAAARIFHGREGAALVLAHLSQRANTPELALAASRAALRGRADVHVAAASQDDEGVVWTVSNGRATSAPAHDAAATERPAAQPRPKPRVAFIFPEARHARPVSTRRCGRCGVPGHYAPTCSAP